MNKLVIALTLAICLMLMAMPTRVSADDGKQTQEQKLEQTVQVECTTGTYGSNNCKLTASQSAEQRQEQYLRLANGRIVRVHKPVNTGIPAIVMAGSVVIATASTITLLAKRR